MTSNQKISEELTRFINTSIPGIPFLEALLLLRSEPARSWTGATVGERLFLPHATAGELLESLCAAGMAIEEPAGVRYRPRSAQLRSMIDRLAECYRDHLIETTRIIHSGAGRNAQIFADAFKLKKEP